MQRYQEERLNWKHSVCLTIIPQHFLQIIMAQRTLLKWLSIVVVKDVTSDSEEAAELVTLVRRPHALTCPGPAGLPLDQWTFAQTRTRTAIPGSLPHSHDLRCHNQNSTHRSGSIRDAIGIYTVDFQHCCFSRTNGSCAGSFRRIFPSRRCLRFVHRVHVISTQVTLYTSIWKRRWGLGNAELVRRSRTAEAPYSRGRQDESRRN